MDVEEKKKSSSSSSSSLRQGNEINFSTKEYADLRVITRKNDGICEETLHHLRGGGGMLRRETRSILEWRG